MPPIEKEEFTMPKIDPKYLEGIKMTGATEKIIEKDGRKSKTSIPWERPATEDDLMDLAKPGEPAVYFKEDPKSIKFLVGDGRKYAVPKKEKREEKKEDKK